MGRSNSQDRKARWRSVTNKPGYNPRANTPVGLNMAEIELRVLQRQCLDRLLADLPAVQVEVAAGQRDGSAPEVTIHWHFTTAVARTQPSRLYPVIRPLETKVADQLDAR